MAEEVSPAEYLLRHVHPNNWDAQSNRPMSGLFRDRRMSVDREALRSLEEASKLKPKHGFARFSAQTATDLGQEVVATPVGQAEFAMDGLGAPSDTYNPAHAEVVGEKPPRVRVALRDACTVPLRPEGYR